MGAFLNKISFTAALFIALQGFSENPSTVDIHDVLTVVDGLSALSSPYTYTAATFVNNTVTAFTVSKIQVQGHLGCTGGIAGLGGTSFFTTTGDTVTIPVGGHAYLNGASVYAKFNDGGSSCLWVTFGQNGQTCRSFASSGGIPVTSSGSEYTANSNTAINLLTGANCQRLLANPD